MRTTKSTFVSALKTTTMKTTYKLHLPVAALATVLALTTVRAADITPAEARAIVKEAYIYGFPLVDNYRSQYSYFVDGQYPELKAQWNQIHNVPRDNTQCCVSI